MRAQATIEIPLINGGTALIDAEDYEKVAQFRWRRVDSYHMSYAVAETPRPNRHTVRMHVLIFGKKKGFEIDHKNGNGLDNRKINLRHATSSQNQANRHKGKGTSQYKGVSWCRSKKRWAAKITVNRKCIPLGRYKSEQEAARAYDGAALLFWGEFARVNFTDSVPGLPAKRKTGRPRKARDGGEEKRKAGNRSLPFAYTQETR